MCPPYLNEPFALPLARDYAPKESCRRSYGFSAIDEVALEDLLLSGLERDVSFYTTHTMCTFDTISGDIFYLGNPLLGMRITFAFPMPQVAADKPRHKTVEVDFLRIPEKLTHQFRKWLFIGNTPDSAHPIWRYQTTQMRMLRLDLKMQIPAEAFSGLEAVFRAAAINTLPLHLYHSWAYHATQQTTLTFGPGDMVRGVEEGQQLTPVLNVWKDFVVVRREMRPRKVMVAVAGDLHYSARNLRLHDAYPTTEDIGGKAQAFAEKTFEMWKAGKLDYLVLNGDLVDHTEDADSGGAWDDPPPYEKTNWLRLEEALQLMPPPSEGGCLISLARLLAPRLSPYTSRIPGLLAHVPVILNAGDHDRLRYAYPVPSAVGIEPPVEGSHYNLLGLGPGEGIGLSAPLTAKSGVAASHSDALRWLYERGRAGGWPLCATFAVGDTSYRLLCLDTGWMVGSFTDDLQNQQYPVQPYTSSGFADAAVDALEEPTDFAIVITHAPPVCLEPGDARHDTGGTTTAAEAAYGSFAAGREALLQKLEILIRRNTPVVVVSSHVHYQSVYAYRNRTSVETGPRIRDLVRRLRDSPFPDMHIEPKTFWEHSPALLFTTPPVGPKPIREGQRAGFLVLHLGADGVSEITFEEVE